MKNNEVDELTINILGNTDLHKHRVFQESQQSLGCIRKNKIR